VVVEASQRHEQVIGETQALPIMMKSLHGRTPAIDYVRHNDSTIDIEGEEVA
jgi:hypothetical protein